MVVDASSLEVERYKLYRGFYFRCGFCQDFVHTQSYEIHSRLLTLFKECNNNALAPI